MGLSAEVGTFTERTTTGNQTVTLTDTGLTPKVIILFTPNLTADGEAVQNYGAFGAWATGSGQAVMAWYDQDAQATMKSARRFNGSKIMEQTDTSGNAAQCAATVSSASAGSFVLNWTVVQGDARIMNYLVLGGTDITDVDLSIRTSPTTAQEDSYDVGFQPDCAIAFGGASTADPGGQTQLLNTLGIYDGTTQASVGVTSHNSPTTSRTSCRHATGQIIDATTAEGAFEVAVMSFDADGYNLNWTTANGSARYYAVLAIKGCRAHVESTASPTSTGTQNVTGGAAEPEGAIIITGGNNNTNYENDIAFGIGVGANASQQASAAWTSDDGAGTSITDRSQQQDEVLQMLAPNQSITEEANWQGTTATGFDLDWTTADGTARNFAALMFIPAAAPAAGFPFHQLLAGHGAA